MIISYSGFTKWLTSASHRDGLIHILLFLFLLCGLVTTIFTSDTESTAFGCTVESWPRDNCHWFLWKIKKCVKTRDLKKNLVLIKTDKHTFCNQKLSEYHYLFKMYMWTIKSTWFISLRCNKDKKKTYCTHPVKKKKERWFIHHCRPTYRLGQWLSRHAQTLARKYGLVFVTFRTRQRNRALCGKERGVREGKKSELATFWILI